MRYFAFTACVVAVIGSASLTSAYGAPAAFGDSVVRDDPAVVGLRTTAVCASPARFPHDFAPAFSPDGLRLAFSRSFGPDGDTRLMIARADGTVTGQIDGGQADWSPDGRLIAYTHNDQLRVIELATGTTRTLAPRASRPHWSPDGRKLAFVDGLFRPAIVNADGTDRRQVSVEGVDQFQFWNAAGIDWSPDGTQFVVSIELEPHTATDLYTLPVEGGRLHQITHDMLAVDPTWSPDGRWIVYASDGTIYSSRGESIVKLVRPDGSGQHRLPPPETAFGWRTRDPAWKDARTVVYSASRPYSSYLRNTELHTIRIDRTRERRLTYHCQFGSQKADTWLTGTYLDDVIYPGGGTDRMRTGPGADVVHARAAGGTRSIAAAARTPSSPTAATWSPATARA